MGYQEIYLAIKPIASRDELIKEIINSNAAAEFADIYRPVDIAGVIIIKEPYVIKAENRESHQLNKNTAYMIITGDRMRDEREYFQCLTSDNSTTMQDLNNQFGDLEQYLTDQENAGSDILPDIYLSPEISELCDNTTMLDLDNYYNCFKEYIRDLDNSEFAYVSINESIIEYPNYIVFGNKRFLEYEGLENLDKLSITKGPLTMSFDNYPLDI